MGFMKTYDPALMHLSVGGVLVTGFGPDSLCKVERDEDGFSKQVGTSGEVARAKNNNRGGKITFTLLASSQCNDLLSAQAHLDEVSGLGAGPAFGQELNGTTLFSAGNAWVKKMPDIERGKDNGIVEWVYDCDEIFMNIGGLLL